jgi:Fe-S-cluster-containing dehydrogenase component
MTIDRRHFFKLATAASTVFATAEASASQPPDRDLEGDFDDAYGVLVDTTFCLGCRKCEWGCNEANDVPRRARTEFDDKTVTAVHRRPDAAAFTVVNQIAAPPETPQPVYAKVQCMHCNHPACASACIVGALRKHPEGPVTYDAEKCIGCRYCMVACPFQIPAYEFARALQPRVMKCGLCADRVIKEGRKPACVENCPNEALTFGRRRELRALAHQKMVASPRRYLDHLYGETEVGGTSWMYLTGIDFARADLPPLGSRPVPELTEKIQHGVFKNFVPPLALFGLLGLVMASQRSGEDGDQ